VGSGTAADTSVVEVNSSVTVNAWTNNAGHTTVQSNCGVVVVSNLTVSGTSLSFFQSCSTAAGASVTLSDIDFSTSGSFTSTGTLTVAGGSLTLGSSGSGSASTSIKGTGNLDLSGGVSVQGSTTATVTVNVVQSGRSAPLVVVDSGKEWDVYGNVMGTAGTVAVNGNLVLGATLTAVQPAVVVNSAGKLVVNTSTSLHAAAWSVAAGATVVMSAGVNGANVLIDNFEQCLGTVQINLATTASVFISSSAAGVGIAFMYGANSNPTQLAQCGVQVVDSAGVTYTLTSSAAASASGRRLLASGTATWGQTNMTFNMGGQNTGGQKNDAASLFCALPLLITGIFVLLA